MNHELVARGRNAKRVLDLPEFKNAIGEVQKDIFEQFKRTNVMDAEAREELHRVAYAVDLFVAKLEKYHAEAEYEIKSSEHKPE